MTKSEQPPLCVDLDGTLLRTDSLWESVIGLLSQNPLTFGKMLLALTRGRAKFKAWVSEQIALDVALLPLNTPLIDWLEFEHSNGRQIFLVTAADYRIAEAVAVHTKLFSEILASDGVKNLKAKEKAKELVSRFGRGGFDYVGDSRADIPVWREARRAIVVGEPALQRSAQQVAEIDRIFPTNSQRLLMTVRALRLHQWVKNLLIFLPLLVAHRIGDASSLAAAGSAFLAFGLTASAVYLLNDMVDLMADRRHPQKCRRPFACGDLPLIWGVILAPVLLLLAATLSLLVLPLAFQLVLAGYFVMTSTYSFKLKRIPIVDIMTLAGLYTIRVIAGTAAVTIMPSFWLLAFSMFIFLSLALVKRYTELKFLKGRGELTAAGRGWHVDDLPIIGAIGVSAGVAGVLVLALYIDSQPARQLYKTPELLWFICPLLLYWISRLWLKTQRGEVHEDPVVFALRDRVSYFVGALAIGFAALATVGLVR